MSRRGAQTGSNRADGATPDALDPDEAREADADVVGAAEVADDTESSAATDADAAATSPAAGTANTSTLTKSPISPGGSPARHARKKARLTASQNRRRASPR